MKKCKATFSIGDDYGDNCATMHCQLAHGHTGHHIEQWNAFGERRGDKVTAILRWVVSRPRHKEQP